MRVLSLLCLSLCFPLFAGNVYTDSKTGLKILSAEIELPSEGFWYLPGSSYFSDEIGYAYIEAPEEHYDQSFGKRNQALRERRLLNERRQLLWSIRYRLGSYNQEEVSLSPENFESLDFNHRPEAEKALRSGTVVIRPGIPVFEKNKENAEILLVELQPQVDDGKHYIYYNTRRLVREEIDAEKMKALGLEIIPPEVVDPKAKTVRYTLKARLFDPSKKEITFRLKNDYPAGEMTITVPISGTTDDRTAFNEWAGYRAFSWGMDESRLADIWDRQVADLYGLEDFHSFSRTPRNRNRGTDIMGVLGGDAAIRETLQMQNLVLQKDQTGSASLIPITEIKGVTVKAHDYEELLEGQAGGSLEMATLCPPDRLFAWFPNPEGILQLLNGSGDVLGRFSNTRSSLILDHRILEKHLAKVGLTEPQLKLILQSGFVGESAILLPDLFLNEGTDVTSITQIKNMPALLPLLKGMGLAKGEKIHEIPTPGGGTAFGSIVQDKYILFSSSSSELDGVLEVITGKAPSLQESAEFRYMLTQCGPTEHSAAYVYLSDPFIRRLTGPALKIAQMRRLQAKGELETLSAGNLLYRMDHRSSAPDIKTLVDAGYAPAPHVLANPEWKDGVATDPFWGSAATSHSLTDRLPTDVTPKEKKAYDQYRDDYERFWRQFFDPIAIRVDLKPEKEVETTVFVLPLINSSIYDQVRQFFPMNEEAQPGKRPHIEPAPIAMMSLNLSENMWIDFLEGISDVVEDQLGVALPIWEQIGPGIHVGLADSDSIITFGSGELFQLFSAGNNARRDEMFILPLIGSVFTRPVVIAMDLKDPDAAREALRGMMTGTLAEENGFLDLNVNLVKITGQDRWLIRIRLGDMLFITLSMEVQDTFLVFSNLPLTYQPKVTGSTPLPLRDANVLLQPGAIQETGPGFAASALDIARKQAMAGLGVLKLYHMAGISSLEDALDLSTRLFGYAPVHPSPGEFIWTDAGPESSVFGPLYSGQQPPLEDLDLTGLLPRTEKVDVSMQLENGGLRTRILWKAK